MYQSREYKVLTLNVGGINKSPFEFFDNISPNAASKTPLEKLSDKMKENISDYLQVRESEGTLNNKVTNIGITQIQNGKIKKGEEFITIYPNKLANGKTVINKKNTNKINIISRTLRKIWFQAKELDRIFSKFSDKRYSIFYREFSKAEIATEITYEVFKKRWLNYFHNKNGNVNRNNLSSTIESVRNILKTTMSKNGIRRLIPPTDDKFIDHEDSLEGLITFDYLAYKSLVNSGIGHDAYVNIKNRNLGIDAKKCVLRNIITPLHECIPFDIIFLQEMSPEFIIDFTGYTSYSDNNTNSMILVKNEIVLGKSVSIIHPVEESPFSNVLERITNTNGKNLTKPQSEIYAIDIGSIILVSVHLNSSKNYSPLELNRLNNALSTLRKSFIVGIDANNTNITGITCNKTNVIGYTSNKVRTWLQTQMNKAGRGTPKQIDYIFTNQTLGETSIVNGGKPVTALAPNETWPFDHFGVTTTVTIGETTAGGAKRGPLNKIKYMKKILLKLKNVLHQLKS